MARKLMIAVEIDGRVRKVPLERLKHAYEILVSRGMDQFLTNVDRQALGSIGVNTVVSLPDGMVCIKDGKSSDTIEIDENVDVQMNLFECLNLDVKEKNDVDDARLFVFAENQLGGEG